MSLSEFLLNNQKQKKLREGFCTLILRVLCSHLEFLKPFQKYVTKHIPHEYSSMFQRKGKAVNLGIIFKNENSSEGMLHILEFLHKYFRNFDERVVFGGDQLTEERAAGVQRLPKMGKPLRQDCQVFFQLQKVGMPRWHYYL